ncbi:MAG TPA: Co2+/Mg2+ efflux protein ApaG [Ferruginibacter sp.]|mgnify:FL=1|jgi:ApaG protein|nr:Co2+/Mg2+ efflux protein ApaG [Ferruginibacter sp.]HRN91182.1 Co2+/Mg2+ efflux protein ApaG [Ferruginibacter sp.]HRO05861.1 Co2+/Mg2+ efflux protein ApaG [Ferruginibacter sp.]HRO96629.1 Co2+/Mg2+ efflux protein ApaG [Ferruginibacter sp.]HRP48839.1 Co2+/Mg2+ efflux protein ApaG [Ferruginibacter sp.]
MVSQISKGVKVSVETYYQPENSNPVNGEFMFAYRITIENHNEFPIQLMRRHWFIYDSDGTTREVEGEGVVGIQPLIPAGQSYQYISGCNLKTEIGKMHGTYLVQNLHTRNDFTVEIPTFKMTTGFKLN